MVVGFVSCVSDGDGGGKRCCGCWWGLCSVGLPVAAKRNPNPCSGSGDGAAALSWTIRIYRCIDL